MVPLPIDLPQPPKRSRALIALWLILLCAVYLALRLPSLLDLPPFNDELGHLRWTQQIFQSPSNAFVSFDAVGKQPLYFWISSPLIPLFRDPLYAMRLSAVLCGLLSLIGTLLLTRELIGNKYRAAPYLVGLLYALCPFAVFHDRLGIMDPLATAWGVLAFYLTYRMLYRSKPGSFWLLGLVLGAALITKRYCVYYLIFPPLLWLAAALDKRQAPDRRATAAVAASLAIGLAMRWGVNFYPNRALDSERFETLSKYLLGSARGLAAGVSDNLRVAADAGLVYLGLPALLLFAAFAVIMLYRRRADALALVLVVLGAVVIEITLANKLYPRYLLFTVPFVLIGAAWALFEICERAGRMLKSARAPFIAALPLLVLALMASIYAYHSWRIVDDPIHAPLAQRDRWQHIEGWPAGFGLRESMDYIDRQAQHGPVDVFFNYSMHMPFNGFKIYFDERPDVRLHLSAWQYALPFSELVDQRLTLTMPIHFRSDQQLVEQITPADMERVFFVGNLPLFDLAKFVELSGEPLETAAFAKPGNKSYIVVMRLQ
ncbi:MAG: glycosyltransferase family 39 protein [Candidatus Alcyoniella australis]|nr:glycosyltransferase family 39 protein [Candidatus Alcyoniella australis]